MAQVNVAGFTGTGLSGDRLWISWPIQALYRSGIKATILVPFALAG
jgi:hypothetical protein